VRRLLGVIFVAVIVATLGLPTLSRADVDTGRAERAYTAMQRYFFDARSDGYRNTLGAGTEARAWPASQALAATLAIARLPQMRAAAGQTVRQRLAHLREKLGSGPVFTDYPAGDVYFDDNEWIAFDLLDWDALQTNAAARTQAVNVFGAIARAWDDDETRPCPGGVPWTTTRGNHDRNTVTTANGAVLGLRLYALTHRTVFLWWSERMLTWLDQCMLAPNGLYWDHIARSGKVNQAEWSYNQGAVLGAYLLLYQTTGQSSALERAETVADTALAYLAPRWRNEPPEFAAIFFRYLLQLAAADGRPNYVTAARTYANQAWKAARNPHTGLFSTNGGGPRLLVQAAFVQLYATLAATSRGPG
jgi:hypothetical protein